MYYFHLLPYSFFSPLQYFTPSSQICTILEFPDTEKAQNTLQTPQTLSPAIPQSFSEAIAKENQSFKVGVVSKEKKQKSCFKDEEYRPDCASGKRKLKMKQIENRNIIPNVIRLIISFIQKKGKSEIILKKLFEKLHTKPGWSIPRFYHYQSMLRSSLNNYVNEETLRLFAYVHAQVLDIYGEEEQRFYNQLSRILINEFFRDDYVGFVLTSKRMDKNKKYHHLTALRNIKSRIKLLLQQRPTNCF